MTWLRQLSLVERVFGPDQGRTLTAGNPYPPRPSSEPAWSCTTRGHVHLFGDDGCVYCSEVD